MKIYYAAVELHNINWRHNICILLSYWDWIGPIPFRKKSFRKVLHIKD